MTDKSTNNVQTAEDVLAYVIDVLLSINTHAYLPTGKADRAIHFLLLLLEEFGPGIFFFFFFFFFFLHEFYIIAASSPTWFLVI